MGVRGRLSALVLGFLLALASPAAAQEGGTGAEASPLAPRSPRLTFDLSLEGRYDDNIIQLSNNDKKEVDSGTPSNPSKFKITTSDDTVTRGSFQVRWITRPFPDRETVLTVDEDIYRYSRNPIKNWNESSLSLSQEISASRKHLLALGASVSYVPDFYGRELIDDDESFAAGTGETIRHSATYSQIAYGLSVEQEVVNNRMHVLLGGELESRNYNHHFDERDGDRTTWSLGLRGKPFERSRLQATLSYARGRLDARGDLASTPIPDHDISYKHDGLELDVAIPWGDRHRGRVELLGRRETREFTTPDFRDFRYWDRVDHRRRYRLRAAQRVARQLDVVADWSRHTNDVRRVFPSEDDDDETGYVENRYTVGLRFRASVR